MTDLSRYKYPDQQAWYRTPQGMASTMFTKAKRRALRDGRDFTITLPYLSELVKAALATGGVTAERGVPDTASLDRIDSRLDYIEGNVQVVPTWYNSAKKDYTAEEIDAAIARYIPVVPMHYEFSGCPGHFKEAN